MIHNNKAHAGRLRFSLATLLIFILFIVLILYLDYTGKSSRRYGKAFDVSEAGLPVHVLDRATDVYALWKKLGYRGRTVIHIGKYLHFVPTNTTSEKSMILNTPVEAFDIVQEYEKTLSYRNFLLVAVQANVARQINNVLPEDKFKQQFLSNKRNKSIKLESDIVEINKFGSKRVIASWIKTIDEPVLLNIDASFFESQDLKDFVKDLKKTGLKIDLLTICLALDNPEVSDASRNSAKELLSYFPGGHIENEK